MIFKQVQEDIQKGIEGLSKGLPTGIPKLDSVLFGIQKGTYYLIGGDTSSGKSAFVNQAFIWDPYCYMAENMENVDIDWIYFSFEMQPKRQFLRFLPRKLWMEFNQIYTTDFLLSKGSHNISQTALGRVNLQKDFFDDMESRISFHSVSLNPEEIETVLFNHAQKKGVFKKDEDGNIVGYTAHSKKSHTIVIMDHNGLIKSNATDKQKIDKVSKLFVDVRNLCDWTMVGLNQFNRGIRGMDRKKFDSQEPTLDDFKDSGNTQQDADVVLALAYPATYGVNEYRKYDITMLKNNFRGLHILKSRDGEPNIHIGLQFMGKLGVFKDLPKADEMTEEDYNKIINYDSITKG